MKLRDLRGAIRKPGNPSVVVELTPGRSMTLLLQKTPLLAELGRVYDEKEETGLHYDAETSLLTYPKQEIEDSDLNASAEAQDDPFADTEEDDLL